MQLDLLEGKKLRDEGINLVASNHPDFLTRCRNIAKQYAALHGSVSTNDIRRIIGEIPKGINPKIMGAIFKENCWEAIGFTIAEQPQAHARPIRIFSLKGGNQ